MGEKGKSSGRITKVPMTGIGMSVLLISITLALASLTVTPVMAQEAKVTVTVNAPEYVGEGETFDVTIDVEDIADFNAGMFRLHFDSSVVKTKEKEVTDGSIDDTEIPITMCGFVDSDTILVMLGLPAETTVSGTGYLAKITFEVKGAEGDECVLEISNGELIKLAKTAAETFDEEEIPADWIDAEVIIGVKEEDEEEEDEEDGEEEEEPTPTPSTSPTPTDVRNATNVTNVTATPTPTPTLAPGVTPTPEAEGTPTPTPKEKATPKPTAPPTVEKSTPTSTPTPKTPGFEAIFAIAVMTLFLFYKKKTCAKRKKGDKRREE